MNLWFQGDPELFFCDNETNWQRLNGLNKGNGYFKDGINDYLVLGKVEIINPTKVGTKAGINYKFVIPANHSAIVKLR